MKIFNTALAISILLLMGCSKDSLQSECVKSMLKKNDMVAYEGQDLGCHFFLELYEYNGKQYFLLGNHCADMIAYPTDCNGKKICESGQDAECLAFSQNAERIGIVGISE